MYCIKGGFTIPYHNIIDWRLICGRMAQAGRAVIDQQGGNKSGASWVGQDAPFFLSTPAQGQVRTYLPPAGRRWYCLMVAVRPPGAVPLDIPSLPSMGQVSRCHWRLVHRTQPRRSPGTWGRSATNKRHRVYTCALLATTIIANK